MKEIVIIIIIIIFIISFDLITQNYTEKSVHEIISQLEEIDSQLKIENENKEEIKKQYENLLSKWEEKNDKMVFYIEHDELEKVETNITSIVNYIESGEYKLALNEIAKNIFVLNHIKDKYQLSLENIF